MAERTTAKEVSVDLAGFKSSVDKQFGLVTKLVFGVYAILGAIIGGGFLLRSDIGEIKSRLAENSERIASLRREFAGAKERVNVLTSNSAEMLAIQKQMGATQGQMVSTLSRLDRRLSAAAQMSFLNEQEARTIREFFGMPKGPPKERNKFEIGDIILNSSPMPDELVAKIPRLKGFRYAKDPGNASLLIVGDDNRIVAVIAPA